MRAEAGEDRVLLSNIAISRIGETAKGFRILRVLGKELHDFGRPRVGGRLKKERVNEAEDGGVDANPEAEGEDGDEAEAGRLEQKAKSVTEIVHRIADGGSA